jgi:radical SAM superfamily enzyme YgiQ (UPF0313 family)
MKLSLVFPSWSSKFGDFSAAARRVSTFPPLNLCIVGSIAKKVGWEVQIVDAHIEDLSDQALIERVGRFGPDLIGTTAATPFFANALRLAGLLKRATHKPTIMGGPHVTHFRELALHDDLDYLVIGECDATFETFLRQFEQGNREPDVPGVMMRREGRVLFGGAAPLLQNLDEAAPLDRTLLPNDLYFLGTPNGNKRYTSLQMSRGCPFSCVFCASDLYGKRVRYRKIEHVVTELRTVIRDHGAEHIYFLDDVLTLNRKYIMRLCDAIESNHLEFTFEGGTRANLWDEEIAKRLRSCGLVRMSFGLESADEEVREIIKKEVPLESYTRANEINNRLGIETTNSVIIGLPGDTRESIERTVQYLCTHREIQHVTLNIAIPYPGTEMLRMAERREHGLKLVEQDFSKFQRYGSAVMEVNGIAGPELIDLQRKALLRIYACSWRWLPVLKRFGIKTLLTTGARTVLSLAKSLPAQIRAARERRIKENA